MGPWESEMHFFKVLFAYAKLGVLNEMQYRVNLLNQLVVSLIGLALSIAGILLVFQHTPSLGVWTQTDLILLLGVHMVVRGFIGLFLRPSLQGFLDGVRTGNFDFVLLKPLDAQLFVCIQRFRPWSLVDILLEGVRKLFKSTRSGVPTCGSWPHRSRLRRCPAVPRSLG